MDKIKTFFLRFGIFEKLILTNEQKYHLQDSGYRRHTGFLNGNNILLIEQTGGAPCISDCRYVVKIFNEIIKNEFFGKSILSYSFFIYYTSNYSNSKYMAKVDFFNITNV